MARICREAGARVRTNVMVRDLDLGAFDHLDGRRLEIIADGLPYTTFVSPIRADGTARRHAAHRMALFWKKHGERRSASIQSWPATGDVHASWWSQPKWGDGSLLRLTSFCEVFSPRKSAACLTFSRGRLLRRGRADGAPCWGAWLRILSRCLSLAGCPQAQMVRFPS